MHLLLDKLHHELKSIVPCDVSSLPSPKSPDSTPPPTPACENKQNHQSYPLVEDKQNHQSYPLVATAIPSPHICTSNPSDNPSTTETPRFSSDPAHSGVANLTMHSPESNIVKSPAVSTTKSTSQSSAQCVGCAPESERLDTMVWAGDLRGLGREGEDGREEGDGRKGEDEREEEEEMDGEEARCGDKQEAKFGESVGNADLKTIVQDVFQGAFVSE
eukprot:495846-Amorphochlora_amoeboformis.AAC.1